MTPRTDRVPETDDRFPSGPWFGYYQQWGTQSRQRLRLEFSAGAISGGGRDPAGEFLIRGGYHTDSGRVSLSKIYDTYRVEYAGVADGDGIGGDWSIHDPLGGADRGIFRIWPDELAMGEARAAKAEEPAPAGA